MSSSLVAVVEDTYLWQQRSPRQGADAGGAGGRQRCKIKNKKERKMEWHPSIRNGIAAGGGRRHVACRGTACGGQCGGVGGR